MNAQKRMARTASQTNPTGGVDPYNTLDKLADEQHEALDFQDWLNSIPTIPGVENAAEQTSHAGRPGQSPPGDASQR